MAKHLLDETAEFRMPGLGRHTSPDTGELEVTQRMEPLDQPGRAHRPRPDDQRAR
ncbi:hypothetical protein [Blastococcus goldschmidtiae]|uniref:Uncharacterized protein n=1 Tax=Blastococcus goldschmidtiae TaxID=3075546 RepID=A0ABU2K8Z3_9ACTN|nr:hypothetical protein [Blastococcus sp. DSM 46792]MDT0276665.1 hypothetical protein [Blastococcus sp. DSM 46792]